MLKGTNCLNKLILFYMKLVFHPLFLLVTIIMIWNGYGLYLIVGILAVLIHESAHAITANHFGVRVNKITLLPFGAQVSIDCAFLPAGAYTAIMLAGSISNAVVSLFAGSFLWLFPQLFNGIGMFITANVSVAILNLLPFYPLDGGKIIEQFANKKLIKGLFIFSNIIFVGLFFVSCFFFFWTLAIFCICMIISVNTESRNEYVTKLCKITKTKKSRVHETAIQSDMTLFDVYKKTSSKYYSKFIVTDADNKIFFETDLEKYLTTYGVDTKIVDILR